MSCVRPLLPLAFGCSLRRCAAALGFVLACCAGAADAWKIPALDGELSGELARITDSTPLRWSVGMTSPPGGGRHGAMKADGPGARVHAEAQLDAAGDGRWRMLAGELDLGRWFGALRSFAPDSVADLSIAGTLTLSGEGPVRRGALGGRAMLVLRDGRLDDPAHHLQLEGIAARIELSDLAARRSPPRQELTWTSGRYDALVLGPGRLVFALDGDTLHVELAALGVFGGELKLGAFSLALGSPEFAVTARLEGAEIAALQPFLPPVLREGRGRLDGELSVRRTAAGVQFGAGRLSLRPGETAALRFAPTPGLLSASLPKAALKLYPGLQEVEQGNLPIQAQLLEVWFTPEGDAQGRTASLRILGGPSDPSLRAPIDLNVNVQGPLESLISFGTNSRLRFGGGK